MKYGVYIHSEAWRAKRADFIDYCKQINKYKCVLCGVKNLKSYAVHHKTYKNFGDEKFEDLALMCKNCHETHHGKGEKKRLRIKHQEIEKIKQKKKQKELDQFKQPKDSLLGRGVLLKTLLNKSKNKGGT